ncbi:efflux RND transporter permease subunit [Thiohalospira sp.]|uniref:efflux RND transporter permease subunit n=1 Tax=Thiohalospira sp. TaxID=3080549 RepID=UPI00397FC88F
MIAAVIRWSLANRFLILTLAALVAAWGAWSADRAPVDAIPDLSDTQVIVQTTWPGQAPEVVEDQVTYPLTSGLLSVPRAETVRGFSYFGDSFVYVVFEDGTDPYWARSRVLESLAQVEGDLPEGAQPELGPDASGVGWVYQYALTDRSGNHDLGQLTALQDWFLQYELGALEGVAEVATVGGMERQYQVVLDPEALAVHDLSVDRVRSALERANQESGGSVVELAEAEYMVRGRGYLRDRDDLAEVSVATTDEGTPVRLADVAEIRRGPAPRRGIAELDGEGEVVGGIVVARYGADTREVIERVEARLEELSDSLPDGVEVVETYDRSGLIDRAVATLGKHLGIELVVVALICAVFLYHLRSTLVVVVSLPLGVLAAIAVMNLQGVTLNIMSLGGIILAIGTMVDAAIVMVENTHRHLGRGGDRREAVARATAEVGPALFFSLLIVTVSFLPVFTLQGQEGRLFAPLAWTKTWAMAAAALLAITLVPVLIALFVRGRVRGEGDHPVTRWLGRVYGPLLRGVLRWPKATVAAAALLVVATVWPLNQLGTEFIPELDEGDLMYMPTTDPGLSTGKAQQLLQVTDRLIQQVPEVERTFGKIGRAETATDPAPMTMIETTITLKPRDEWREGMTLEKLKAELDDRVDVPGLTNAWVMPIKTRIDMLSSGVRTPVGIRVTGPELETIQSLGREIEQAVADLPGTRSAFAERVAAARYIDVDVDRRALARHGVDMAEVQELLRLAVGGAPVTETVEGRERYPVNLRFPADRRTSLEDLRSLPVVAGDGRRVALGEVADIGIREGPGMVKSEQARPVGWVHVDLTTGDLAGWVERAQEVVAEEVELPPGYSLDWAGQYQNMERARGHLLVVGPLVLVLIALLLYLNFRAAGEVLLILATLPLALVGGVWLLWGLGYNLSVGVGVGFIAVAGVAVELGVLMVVYLGQAWAAARGAAEAAGRSPDRGDLAAALEEGALRRVRPITMTAVSVILGLATVMVGGGTGSEVMRRVAAPMMGGMLSAWVLALLVVPAVFWLWKGRGLQAAK